MMTPSGTVPCVPCRRRFAGWLVSGPVDMVIVPYSPFW
jgi:hypothetical protein